ncbi:GNAT family N-acetyltransferase [Streptomyces sp. NPDC057245]|uniref:GNAT family N-acetyltransferase n=1 Tax=Streptomyces sp. NPDC057245 TaxID=3346065 RepID=UPI00362D18B6
MASGETEIQVRPGVEDDLKALTDLYNHYVRETAITFDTEPFTPRERRAWLLSHPEDGPHRLRVATNANSGSARLHARFGFRHVGTHREVGRKFGRYWDVAWYEKPL